jgi:hypothetical protein
LTVIYLYILEKSTKKNIVNEILRNAKLQRAVAPYLQARIRLEYFFASMSENIIKKKIPKKENFLKIPEKGTVVFFQTEK